MGKGFRRNRKGARKGGKKMTFAKRVLAVLNGQRELKAGVPLAGNIADVRQDISAATRATNILPVLGTITQGNGENNRIGNQIMLKKIVIRGYYKMSLPSGSAAASRILIRSAIMRQRNISDASSLVSGALAVNYGNLLEPASSYTGSVGDFNTPWNRDAVVIRKEFKRTVTTDFIPAPATNAEGLAESYVFFNYTMTFGQGKLINYQNDVVNTSLDFPFFLAHSASAMGSLVVLPTNAVTFNYIATPYFYDN